MWDKLPRALKAVRFWAPDHEGRLGGSVDLPVGDWRADRALSVVLGSNRPDRAAATLLCRFLKTSKMVSRLDLTGATCSHSLLWGLGIALSDWDSKLPLRELVVARMTFDGSKTERPGNAVTAQAADVRAPKVAPVHV